MKTKTKKEVHTTDRIFYWTLKIMAWAIIGLLLLIVGLLTVRSFEVVSRVGFGFLFGTNWDPTTNDYGILSVLYGTIVTSLLALLLAVPTSFAVALFLNELSPRWLSVQLCFFVEMLSAIPSIVYGLWGLFVLAPFLRNHVQYYLSEYLGNSFLFSGPPMGVGLMCASCVLAIMITPTIVAISREVFRTIPASNREAVLGLGATRWEVLKIAVLRASQPGLIAAVILGLGRAMGETMAVTMVIGNMPDIHFSLLSAGQTMASLLANQYAEASDSLHLSALTGVALCLFLVSILTNAVARTVVWRIENRFKGKV